MKFAILGGLAILISGGAVFYYTIPPIDGRRVCEQAAATAAKAGRDGPAALKACEDAGREVARKLR